MKSYLISFLKLALLLPIIFAANVNAVVDVDAAVVELRDPNNGGCTVNGATLDNCFTTISGLLTWINSIRNPKASASAPLLVSIGPGTYGQLTCSDGNTNITYQGAGMGQTKLATVSTFDCDELVFSDLSVGVTGSTYAVFLWHGGKHTTWKNVELGSATPWAEYGCTAERGRHDWFSSRIVGKPILSGQGYLATCDESWFYGSEITVSHAYAGFGAPNMSAIKAEGNGEIHVYGSVLRVLNETADVSTPLGNSAAYATDGGIIHIHGTGIDVISDSSSDIAALKVDTGGLIHANSSAYSFKTGASGTFTRVVNNGGNVMAPYLWQQSSTPPNVQAINADGADMAVQTVGSTTRLLVYNSSCTGVDGPWFNVVTASCL